MNNWFTELCGAAFMPHGQCYLWQPELMTLHGVSDALIALSYYSIPLVILHFVRKRRDIPFPGIFLMFGAFIVACGTTHLIEVWTIWQPHYWLSGLVKAFTAIISLVTAVALVRIVPVALNLPSHEDLRRLNADLETRVQARTTDLTAANARLQDEVRQREQAEAEVRALNLRLQQRIDEMAALFDLLPVGIGIASDSAGRHIRSNTALAALLGTSTRDNVSLSAPPGEAPQPFKIFKEGRELASAELPMQLAMSANRSVLDFEETIVRGDGQRVEIVANAVPLHNEAGEVRGCVATFVDVTARKQAAEDRLAFERQLQETQKLEGLGVLAGGIAHDFNNLLTGIVGNTSLARLGLLPHQGNLANSLLNIEQSSLRAADLCKQLLAYAGKGRFVIEAIDLSTFVQETAQMLEISISKKTSLQLHLSPDLPPFQGDATQIRQVLMNLVINASEAIGDRTGTVTIQTGLVAVTADYLQRFAIHEHLAEGEYVCLEVADNGSGMSAETQARIFDPFYTTKFTGRGLGLAAVLGIIRGHKGAIKVYSEPGRGTTFKLLFPVTGSEGAASARQRAAATATPWHGSGHALIIDDEPFVRTVADQIFKVLGFTTALACDGLEAVEIVEASPDAFTIVLLDLTMPRMDGEETLRKLRTINPNLRIILTSGFNEQSTINRFVGRGIAGFLPKPFTVDMLGAQLRKILG
jgi:two-component system, cell cycle sensor histidine kinase and response regulator CckA